MILLVSQRGIDVAQCHPAMAKLVCLLCSQELARELSGDGMQWLGAFHWLWCSRCRLDSSQEDSACLPGRQPEQHVSNTAGNGKLQGTVLEKLTDAGVSVLFVTIGPAERGKEFSKLTGFPEDKLLADPEMHIYEALKFKNTW